MQLIQTTPLALRLYPTLRLVTLQIVYPALLIDREILIDNLRHMQDYADKHGVFLRGQRNRLNETVNETILLKKGINPFDMLALEALKEYRNGKTNTK